MGQYIAVQNDLFSRLSRPKMPQMGETAREKAICFDQLFTAPFRPYDGFRVISADAYKRDTPAYLDKKAPGTVSEY